MNKKNYLWSLLLFLFVSIFSVSLVSCGDDDDDNSNESTITENDPEGTIIANVQNTFHHRGNYWYDGISCMGCWFGFNSANNLEAGAFYDGSTKEAKIVSVGKVKGLSAINKIPDSGWTNQMAVIVGNGYIFRIMDFWGGTKYARIYITGYIKSEYGDITGITLKYQENWKPDTE